MKRSCAYCTKEITKNHIRIWEEEESVSHMISYCNYYCQSRHVFARSNGTIENIVIIKDLRK